MNELEDVAPDEFSWPEPEKFAARPVLEDDRPTFVEDGNAVERLIDKSLEKALVTLPPMPSRVRHLAWSFYLLIRLL